MQGFHPTNSTKGPVVVTAQARIDTKANLAKMSALTIDSIKLLLSCSSTDPNSVGDELKPAQTSVEALRQVEYLNELV